MNGRMARPRRRMKKLKNVISVDTMPTSHRKNAQPEINHAISAKKLEILTRPMQKQAKERQLNPFEHTVVPEQQNVLIKKGHVLYVSMGKRGLLGKSMDAKGEDWE